MNGENDLVEDEQDHSAPVIEDESVEVPIDKVSVIDGTSSPSPAPLWVGVIFAVWIIAHYFAFYYFLIAHRYESYAMGG